MSIIKNCTIDEQLLSFRGRCAFRMYLPAKPDKYGLKIVSIHDAETHYMFDAIPYVGAVDKEPAEAVPSYYVRKLTQSIYHSGRNVTMDNWFTSIPIALRIKKESDLTTVDTLRKNKAEIPLSFKKIPPPGTNAQFCFKDDMSLTSHNPKKKIVLLLSTYHKNVKMDTATNKPDVVLFNNKTKGAVDSFDKNRS